MVIYNKLAREGLDGTRCNITFMAYQKGITSEDANEFACDALLGPDRNLAG